MKKVANVLVALVALEHVYILVLEMFLWTRPAGLRAFGLTQEFAEQTAVLAANQGLYNGFLAAGLIWGLLLRDKGFPVKVFFLVCVTVAGVFGAITAKPSILFVQAVPAALALIVTLVANRR
jgi:putative membrane protein